jgi:hypothetical protein
MCRDYWPSVTLNGVTKRVVMKCYIIVDPYDSEPSLKANAITWYDSLPILNIHGLQTLVVSHNPRV